VFTLWVLCHAGLVVFAVFFPLDLTERLRFGGAIAYSFVPTILVFVLLFLTPPLVARACRWLRLRTGTVLALTGATCAYIIGLGTLAAALLFSYRLGFSTEARLAFAAFAVATCGILSSAKGVRE
jgi:hypothetical protein